MSLEIILYVKKATKPSLIKVLKENGFKRANSIFPEAKLDFTTYVWFEYNEYQSIVGVEAVVRRANSEEKEKYNCNEWILHTRTRASGSYEDKKKQNDIVKLVRHKFSGSFYNDWYGVNTYTNLNDYPKYLPVEKAISILQNIINEKISSMESCLNDYRNPISESFKQLPNNKLSLIIRTKDPSIILYNALLPFFISLVEHFFKKLFVELLTYQDSAKTILMNEKIKIDIQDVLKISSNELAIEDILVQTHNFQNLENIHKVYKKYFNVDIFSILSAKKKINGKIYRIKNILEEIISRRHRMVHELEFDYLLTKEDCFTYLEVIKISVDLVVKEINQKNGYKSMRIV